MGALPAGLADAAEQKRIDFTVSLPDDRIELAADPLLLQQLLADLGVTRSLSRPQVSDDNPFSEAQFKTMKYRPDYPDRFGSLEDARAKGAQVHRGAGALPRFRPAMVTGAEALRDE